MGTGALNVGILGVLRVIGSEYHRKIQVTTLLSVNVILTL